ncbi:hypothetical protein ACXYTJ_00230 [Gilvimarinus sp. F26214L]|uniref:hypothetical protein n=1 Tax=Gilvimarinus sp. DZF01 TaxID=3461371 RepID=UPI0040462318
MLRTIIVVAIIIVSMPSYGSAGCLQEREADLTDTTHYQVKAKLSEPHYYYRLDGEYVVFIPASFLEAHYEKRRLVATQLILGEAPLTQHTDILQPLILEESYFWGEAYKLMIDAVESGDAAVYSNRSGYATDIKANTYSDGLVCWFFRDELVERIILKKWLH